MNIRSAKAKGRRLAALLRAKFLEVAPHLQGDDIVVTPSSVCGPDLWLSPKAKETFNFGIECKNQESIAIWKSFEQAETHVKNSEVPLLVFMRNRSEPMVCLKLDDFLKAFPSNMKSDKAI